MPITRNAHLSSGLNGTAEKVLQLPNRGRYGLKIKTSRRQFQNRHAAAQGSHRGALQEGQPPLLCTGLSHSACHYYTHRTLARRFLS
jgi:hypothetical protein